MTTKMRPAIALALFLGALASGPGTAADADGQMKSGIYDAGYARRVDLGLGKSLMVALPRDAKEVFVADPKIANAVVRSARQAYLIGSAIGQTTILFLDAEGKQIMALDVNVGRDLVTLQGTIGQTLGRGTVTVQAAGDAVILSGSVNSVAEAQTAVDIAVRYVADPTKVVNSINIKDRDQVLLKVTVAEVQRNIIKQLGVDFNIANWELGTAIIGPATSGRFPLANPFETNNRFPINQQSPSGNYSMGWKMPGGGGINATVRAMEQYGVFRTLAEPTLTAISGESAKFLVGGEFPIITGIDNKTNTPTVEFKEFGVRLNFIPVVLGEGRISLKVSTEVSEISNEVAIELGSFRIPGLRVRRADSTVELPSGGSLVMAGLIQNQTRQTLSGTPGLMNIPVLGALFKSRDYQRQETELAIFVTPYLAKAVARSELAKPDDGFADPSDPSTVLLGRLNRLYGIPGKIEPASFHGSYGFIID
jgi:pilus assembly protein CpaC